MTVDRFGEWIVEGALGKGGMASVFRAHAADDPSRKAAIKVCDLANHPEALARFGREAALLQSVDHRGVVRVFEARLDTSPPFLAMELVEGEQLGDLVLRLGPLPVRGALLVARSIADVLAHLHARAMYHRDLKPANLIVLPDQTVKLVDFGIARVEGKGRLTMADSRMGTAAYCPPEWIQPDKLLPQQWDLYALGVVLHEMLTGEERFPPRDGEAAMAHAVRVMAEKAATPHLDPGPEFPEPVRALVRSLTAREVGERPTTARAVHHALSELLRSPAIATATGRAGLSAPPTFRREDQWLASQDSPPEVADAAGVPSRPRRWLARVVVAAGGAAAVAAGAVAALLVLALVVAWAWW
jgi:serine/threonine protein kinase